MAKFRLGTREEIRSQYPVVVHSFEQLGKILLEKIKPTVFSRKDLVIEPHGLDKHIGRHLYKVTVCGQAVGFLHYDDGDRRFLQDGDSK